MNPQLFINTQNHTYHSTLYYSDTRWSDLFIKLRLSQIGVCFIESYRKYNHLEEISVRFEINQEYRIKNSIEDNNFNSLHNNYSTFTQTSSIHISYRSDKAVLLDMIRWSKPDYYDYMKDLFQSNNETNWDIAYESILTLYGLRE